MIMSNSKYICMLNDYDDDADDNLQMLTTMLEMQMCDDENEVTMLMKTINMTPGCYFC